MTIEERQQKMISIVKQLSGEQCKHVIRVLDLIKPLADGQAGKALDLLQSGMSLEELATLLENGGLAV